MPITRPAVSRHLRLLKEAGLVTVSAEGTRRLYRLPDEGVEAVRAYLEEVWGDARRALPSARRQSRRDVIDPLRIAFDVSCPPEQTFELWTARTGM
jgi:DNA-binding PadR family transcriptional regulator